MALGGPWLTVSALEGTENYRVKRMTAWIT